MRLHGTGHGEVHDYTVPSEVHVTNKGLITQKRKFDGHSHSFQDSDLKLHRHVSDSPRQVVERLTILLNPHRWVGNKGVITQTRKFDVHSDSFRNTELKLHRYVRDSPGQVVNRLTILLYPQRGQE